MGQISFMPQLRRDRDNRMRMNSRELTTCRLSIIWTSWYWYGAGVFYLGCLSLAPLDNPNGSRLSRFKAALFISRNAHTIVAAAAINFKNCHFDTWILFCFSGSPTPIPIPVASIPHRCAKCRRQHVYCLYIVHWKNKTGVLKSNLVHL